MLFKGIKTVSYTHLDVYKRQASTTVVNKRSKIKQGSVVNALIIRCIRPCLLYTSRCV